MKSICKFMPPTEHRSRLEPLRFVYETDVANLRQPFMSVSYSVHAVTSGTACFTSCGRSYELKEGSVFFTLPGCEYTLTDYRDFCYVYISFIGERAESVLEAIGVDRDCLAFDGLPEIADHLLATVRRVTQRNSVYLAESSLLFALALVSDGVAPPEHIRNNENLYVMIMNYIDGHYCDKDLSLAKIGRVFSYSDKYISTLIKRNLDEGFVSYVTTLRIERAKGLLKHADVNISDVADACGFSDPLYFSKVFKRHTGTSPTEYINAIASDPVVRLIRKYAFNDG